MIDLTTLRAGDSVTIKCTVDHVDDETVLLFFDVGTGLTRERVSRKWIEEVTVSHEPKPFDWSEVKPGMAFYSEIYGTCWYIGPDISDEEYAVIASDKKDVCRSGLRVTEKLTLIRAPEHDIEAQS